ncbi:hypothetical protein PQX77_002052 [Marasmius sp. AFHP31]|nr:hypothetical protein PQX77_002052 [Marasmius sp. AFHP31]
MSVHVPREESENTILLHIIDVTPDILNAEDKATSVTTATKHRVALYLQPLVAQIWLFLVDVQDPRIEPWSSLLLYLPEHAHNPPISTSSIFEHDRRIFNIPRPYPNDAKPGKRLLVELQLKVRHLTKGKNPRIGDFRTFFLVLIVGNQCFRGTNPICVGEENYNETLRLMGRVLAIILRKWTWLHKRPIESTQLEDAYSIATCLLSAFCDSLRVDTPSRIPQLVESGIVTSLYYAAECYYTLGRSEATIEMGGFIEATTRSDHHLSSPLLRFASVDKQSKDLRFAWSNLLGKADELYLGMKQNIDSFKELAGRAFEVIYVVHGSISEHKNWSDSMERNLKHLMETLKDIRGFAKSKVKKGVFPRICHLNDNKGEIVRFEQRLDQALDLFNMVASIETYAN